MLKNYRQIGGQMGSALTTIAITPPAAPSDEKFIIATVELDIHMIVAALFKAVI